MNLRADIRDRLPSLAEQLTEGWDFPGSGAREKATKLAPQKSVQRLLHDLVGVLFPGCHGDEPIVPDDPGSFVHETLADILELLDTQVRRAFEYSCSDDSCGDEACPVYLLWRLAMPFLPRRQKPRLPL